MLQWTLVFHLLGLVFWVGSLLVVTHVLAVHTDEAAPEARQALGRLELKLLRGLAHPGAALMVITGVVLILTNREYLHAGWLRAKLPLVAILAALDVALYLKVKAFAAGQIELKRRQCMIFHGAIALVFTGVLILVLVKPI